MVVKHVNLKDKTTPQAKIPRLNSDWNWIQRSDCGDSVASHHPSDDWSLGSSLHAGVDECAYMHISETQLYLQFTLSIKDNCNQSHKSIRNGIQLLHQSRSSQRSKSQDLGWQLHRCSDRSIYPSANSPDCLEKSQMSSFGWSPSSESQPFVWWRSNIWMLGWSISSAVHATSSC